MRFLLIDRITVWEAGRSATALKNVALSEDFFEDHFPTKPIMPGTLIIEGIAQLGGLLLEDAASGLLKKRVKALMAVIEKAKFRSPVYPGDQLEYIAEIDTLNELGGKITARALCRGELCAECRLVFSFHEYENQRLEQCRQQIVSLWKRELEDV